MENDKNIKGAAVYINNAHRRQNASIEKPI
jgi:hypothetical protein